VTGEQLLSVTTSAGTVSYTYTADSSGPRAHALTSITSPAGTSMFFDYDNDGRLKSQQIDSGAQALSFSYDIASVRITDAKNEASTLFMDDTGKVVGGQNALGNGDTFQFNGLNQLTSVGPQGGGTSTLGYDAQGNIDALVDPLGARQTFSYDPAFNNLASFSDALGNVTTFGHDANGNPSSSAYADGSSEHYSYDANGNLQRAVDRNGQVTLYTYNSQGLLASRQLADGSLTTYTYDAHANLRSATDARGTITMQYDAADRLAKITYPDGRFLSYTYDAGGRRTQTLDQTGFTENYGYDGAGRLATLTDGSGNLIVQYTYNNVGQLVRKDEGNRAFTTYEYDADGQLLHLVNYAPDGSVNSRFDYTYDTLGRRSSQTTLDGTTTYGYDGDGRLISVVLPTGRAITYQYDAAGNRVSVTDNGVNTAYTTDNLNEYTAIGGTGETYDPAGDLTSSFGPGGNASYTYDALNRLIGVTTPFGTWSYEYDALGNRVVMVHNGLRTEYLVDPLGLGDVVGEFDGAGQLVAHYTQGLGLTSRVDAANTTAYYDFDATGSAAGLTGANGNYVNRYRYLPFGETLSASESVANPFRYGGAFGAQDDGAGLTFMRARYYNPAQGRFTQPDPIGLAGGSDLYAYVANNPTGSVDPTGLGGPGDPKGLLDWFNANDLNPTVRGSPPVKTYEVDPETLKSRLVEAEKDLTSDEIDALAQKYLAELASKASARGLVEIGALGALAEIGVAFVGGYVIGQNLYAAYYFNKTGDLPPCLSTLPMFAQTCGHIPVVTGAPSGTASTTQVAPSDPNFIAGPGGFGAGNFVVGDATYPYVIGFENKPSASAPAQQVVITETLDPNLDLGSFRLGDFGFGDVIVHVPDGRQVFGTRIDARATRGVFVDVNAGLNVETRVVTWTFTSIDPKTLDLPSDPSVGFLPPDNAAQQGEGFVTYTIRPKAGDPTGTQINAKASVVFDTNAPVLTNSFLNTIDAGAPTSSVNPLPAITTTPSFTVSWSGSDDPGGSGIASFDVFVSDNGGPFTPFLTATPATSTTFNGVDGHTYGFSSVATDNVGNREAQPTAAQATTKVQVPDLPLSAAPVTVHATQGVPFTSPVATFTDADPNGVVSDFTAHIDWGDGQSSAGTIAAAPGGGFTVLGTHTYGGFGTFQVAVAIADIGGSMADTTSQALVVSAGPVNVDSRVGVTFTGYVFNRIAGTFDTRATITNTSSSVLLAPMTLVVTSITPNSVTLANATGHTPDGLPFVAVPVPDSGLAPGASMTNILLQFRDPTRVNFAFTSSVFAVVAPDPPAVVAATASSAPSLDPAPPPSLLAVTGAISSSAAPSQDPLLPPRPAAGAASAPNNEPPSVSGLTPAKVRGETSIRNLPTLPNDRDTPEWLAQFVGSTADDPTSDTGLVKLLAKLRQKMTRS
jgi:RHS repeat-associated protein